jgi:ferric-dicitrate binding protein FerR (iron transport regulator)
MKVHASRRRRVFWLALAAGAAAAAIGSFLLLLPSAPLPAVADVSLLRGGVERWSEGARRWEPLAADAALSVGARLRTAANGGVTISVFPGISVRADGATRWSITAATRLELEAGTLYIDTGRSSASAAAIEIATAHGVVRDLGTQFEVRALSSELRLRVREGLVQLEPMATPVRYETSAAEELRLFADGAVERRPIATDGVEWAWAEALAAPLELDGGSAFEALQWVARETGKRLVFEDANAELLARRAIIHGSSAGLEPLQVLEVVMATSAGLDYSVGDGVLVIRRR